MHTRLVRNSFLGIFSFCFCLFSTQPAFTQVDRPIKDKWALVIGISKFKDKSIPALQYAAKDAIDFKNFLVKEGNFQNDHILLLTDENATYENIRTAIGDDWLPRRVTKDDLVLVFVSSHGSPKEIDIGKDNFLITHDTRRKKLFATGLKFEDLAATIKDRTGCDRIVLIFDACNSGAAEAGGKGLYRAGNFDINSLVGEGQIVISSSDANQRSWESKRYKNGVFTHCLINALKPVNGKQTTIDEAFTKLKDKVEQEVRFDRRQDQTPIQKSKWKGRKLCLLAKPTQPRSVPEPVPGTDHSTSQLYTIDRTKCFKNIKAVAVIERELKKEEDEIHALIASVNKEFNKAKKSGLTQTNLKSLRKDLQVKIDENAKVYTDNLNKKRDKIKAAMDTAITQEAKARGIPRNNIQFKSATNNEGIDITSAISQRADKLLANPANSISTDFPSPSNNTSTQLLLVDKTKLLKSMNPKAMQAELKSEEASLRRLVKSSNEEYNQAKKSGRSQSYLKSLRADLQVQIDRRTKSYQNYLIKKENQLREKIKLAFEKEAKSRGVPKHLIQFKDVLNTKGIDITDSVIKQLNAL